MNQNPDIIGGAGEQVVDILENIPSDAERRAATDAPTRRDGGGAGHRFRRPASFTIFRPRDQQHQGLIDITSLEASADAELALSSTPGEQTAGEEPEERRITAIDVQKKKGDIYNISGSEDDEVIDPMSQDYIGIVANYFSVGLMIGGSTSLLYPILIVKDGATASLMTASYAVVMVFWSYKIIFGFLSDCFPICGYKRKPYITIGWIFCAGVLISVAEKGNEIDSRHLVLMLALANMGYVWADVAADGFMGESVLPVSLSYFGYSAQYRFYSCGNSLGSTPGTHRKARKDADVGVFHEQARSDMYQPLDPAWVLGASNELCRVRA